MKVALVGSREYPNLSKVRAYIQTLPADPIIVSVGARGAEKVAECIGLQIEIYPADWLKFGNLNL